MIQDIIVILIITATVLLTVRSLVRQLKGKKGCNCKDCDRCSGNSQCSSCHKL